MDDAEAADAVVRALAKQLNSKHQRAIDVFRKIDVSGDGSVTSQEFFAGLRAMQLDVTEDDFGLLMRKLDKDGSGDVTLKEFSRALKLTQKHLSDLPPLTPRAQQAFRSKSNRAVKQEPAEPSKEELDVADEFLIKVVAQLNERKARMIDLFRRIDLSGDGAMSAQEFRAGLLGMGFKPTKEEFRSLIQKLDNDKSGDVSIAEFDSALRRAVRLAKREGREGELTTWHGQVKEFHEPTNWAIRSMSGTASDCFASTFSAFNNSTTSSFGLGSWASSSGGPRAKAASSSVGSGSIVDSSVGRVRLFDRGPAPHGSERSMSLKERADCTPRGFAHAAMAGRFGREPPNQLPKCMTLGRKTQYCKTSTRDYGTWEIPGGVKVLGNSPMTQSCIDTVVFGHDMDFSADAHVDDDFAKIFVGAAGSPSWRWGK